MKFGASHGAIDKKLFTQMVHSVLRSKSIKGTITRIKENMNKNEDFPQRVNISDCHSFRKYVYYHFFLFFFFLKNSNIGLIIFYQNHTETA